MARARIEALTKIADLKYQSMQLKMAKLLQQEHALRQNLQQLTEQKTSSATTQEPGSGLAALAAVDLRWHRWVDQRRTIINLELAQVLAQQEELRLKLQQAFGKSQVVQTLAVRAAAARRQAAVRRTDYES